MPFEPDPYRILGLARGATLDEVKRAYRRLAKANHPDAAGPSALTRFLAIQAAYEAIAGPTATNGAAAPGGRAPSRPMTREPEGGRRPGSAPGARPRPGSRPGATGPRTSGAGEAGAGPARGAGGGPAQGGGAGSARGSGSGPAAAGAGRGNPDGEDSRSRRRGKATLGSTSYDGADSGPFEPDWGGASWYGTTSGTYWTINPKEYADPRKHGPEYQARARRSAGAGGRGGEPAGPAPDPDPVPRHTTGSWWASTAGPEDTTEPMPGTTGPSGEPEGDPVRESTWPGAETAKPAGTAGPTKTGRAWAQGTAEPAPDPARAAVDLGRALTDPRSGGLRGRVLRAVLGWIPIALGIGWLVGELTGCGRFAATCDPSVAPLTAVGQGIVLAGLLLVPEIAAITAGAAIVLLMAAIGATLILSATGAAADEASRRAALGALLLLAWSSGLVIAVVRRLRGREASRPVS
jgi:DnaJ domain